MPESPLMFLNLINIINYCYMLQCLKSETENNNILNLGLRAQCLCGLCCASVADKTEGVQGMGWKSDSYRTYCRESSVTSTMKLIPRL
jgi:hypothetical protein